ncbi:hypothetical protein [Nonomuraea wenchangensis]|uniref:Uncharacterized protein n=1 Tax=Nonomuraea wenchangensis TaxID=568860 RepID=A0A1I0LVJ2_9ACTN|nr:hypothetical protein [Nonomuraea wenchangensis]SEU46598.1 hypothetical protein SAMN05421811_12790 [Nonomuraea wenchangensis]
MRWRYANANTGDVVLLDERDPCLDMLPNWTVSGSTSVGEPESGPSNSGQATPGRPPESANKAAWVAYAVARGMAEADAKGLRKDALIEEFGENSDNDDEEGGGGGQD